MARYRDTGGTDILLSLFNGEADLLDTLWHGRHPLTVTAHPKGTPMGNREDANKAPVIEAFDTPSVQSDYIAADGFWSPDNAPRSAQIAACSDRLNRSLRRFAPVRLARSRRLRRGRASTAIVLAGALGVG